MGLLMRVWLEIRGGYWGMGKGEWICGGGGVGMGKGGFGGIAE